MPPIAPRIRVFPGLPALLSVVAVGVLWTAFVFPNRFDWFDHKTYLYLPIEFFVFGLALLVPGRAGQRLSVVLAIILTLGMLLRVADMVTFQVFSRAFNPVFDIAALSDAYHFLSTSVGDIGAFLAALLALVLLLVLGGLAYLVLAHWRNRLRHHPRHWTGVMVLGVVLWGVLSAAGWPRASRYFHDQLVWHGHGVLESLVDLREFRGIVDQDVYAKTPGEDLFGKLRGKDVLVVFVESYGRTLVDKQEYAQAFRPHLTAATQTLASAGFAARSAYLTSPTVGGISWLAHGTALSGLWIDNQVRYNSLMMSERPSLVRLFARAGWRTVGVMPAIGMAWPEGDYFGYEALYTVPELGYKGLPYNYVTMPDQFTLAQFQKFERSVQNRSPVMAEIALVSSHAPWTPVPSLIPWEEVGDGSEFNAQATAGESAEVVWQDRDRVLRQYRECAEYVIDALVSYVTHFGDENLVMLIIGDHQPMPYVTDNTDNRDVLVHLIARDPAVMDAVQDWQWTPGMLPADDAPVWRMDNVRDRVIETFSF